MVVSWDELGVFERGGTAQFDGSFHVISYVS